MWIWLGTIIHLIWNDPNWPEQYLWPLGEMIFVILSRMCRCCFGLLAFARFAIHFQQCPLVFPIPTGCAQFRRTRLDDQGVCKGWCHLPLLMLKESCRRTQRYSQRPRPSFYFGTLQKNMQDGPSYVCRLLHPSKNSCYIVQSNGEKSKKKSCYIYDYR